MLRVDIEDCFSSTVTFAARAEGSVCCKTSCEESTEKKTAALVMAPLAGGVGLASLVIASTAFLVYRYYRKAA